MALSKIVNYTGTLTPDVEIVERSSLVSSAKVWTATVTIGGLNPTRNTTAEERSAGISSLSPPVVTAGTVQNLVNLAIRAAASSYESTDGQEFTPTIHANLTVSVSNGILGALRLLDVDA